MRNLHVASVYCQVRIPDKVLGSCGGIILGRQRESGPTKDKTDLIISGPTLEGFRKRNVIALSRYFNRVFVEGYVFHHRGPFDC